MKRNQPVNRRSRVVRRGFTMIELLVSLTIIGLLLSLIIPAVQSVRESARRVQCQNNLHQIGLAMHNYHEVKGCFPYGQFGTAGYLLPYLGHGDIYSRFEADYPTSVLWAQSTVLPIFRCPTDGMSLSTSQGTLSYATNIGTGWLVHGFNGFWDEAAPIRLSNLTDGASQTAAMSEMLYTGGISLERLRATWFILPGMMLPSQRPAFLSACEQLPETQANLSWEPRGEHWYDIQYYDHQTTPQKKRCHNGAQGGSNSAELSGVVPAVSGHGQGVNVLLADGAVRYVSQSIDSKVWEVLGSRSAGDVLSSGF